MGYIIPVENYQYQQYHNRDTRRERDPFPIEKLYPIQFGMHYKQERTREEPKKVVIPQQKKRVHQQITEKESQTKHHTIYAEVTGKGGNFEANV
ncbi:hypothetical protein SAMN04487943_101173 [Gracilibacillus orientalis]|uniref:Uncharacterized protein n=1 Tax=Gracilibacillus orientalis TaxID=334253 RepID=A0A1I4H2E3_9BACI|nr:hypothetical protein [Gracilibacillus orientalis]SFL36355.1 hypothetical protein SAMN04487943_101173 [Gracilibacillus orientalis]